MAEKSKKSKNSSQFPTWLVTPILLLMLSASIVMLSYILLPTHSVQKYLNIAFMDDLKTKDVSSGLNIVNKDISKEDGGKGNGKVIAPKFGEKYAILECKDIGLEVGVYFGSDAELLALGACQASNSSILGLNGNTVISAHVNSYFSNLAELEEGDTVTLYTEYGKFTYQVAELIRFNRSDSTYVKGTTSDILTLYTCEAQVLGNSSMRVGAVCNLVEKELYDGTETPESPTIDPNTAAPAVGTEE